MAYTVTGPFANGGAPGISASFLNNVETWIETVDAPAGTPSTPLAGGTSGTAQLFQVLNGIVKLAVINTVNFRTAGAAQNIVLPTPFTTFVYVITGNLGNGQAFQLLSASVAQNMAIITALASAGGTGVSQTNFAGNTFCSVVHAIDTFSFVLSASSSATGPIILIGI